MSPKIVEVIAAAGILLGCSGCVTVSGTGSRGPTEPGGGPPPAYGNLGIPPGHLPPPGECRLWYPGQPPGHQPPPGRCDRLAAEAPPGAWVLYRPPHEPEHVHVRVIDRHRPPSVVEIRVYDADRGVFIRVERP